MTMDRALRLTSGVFLLLMLVVGILPSNAHWFWKFFLLFMSLNQIQSAFTNWCPVITLYRKLGIKECA
jgi:hypothetical protein